MEFGDLGKIADALKDANAAGLSRDAAEEIFSDEKDAFDKISSYGMDLKGYDIVGEPGELKFQYDGKDVDFNSAENAMKLEGDVEKAFKEIGAPDEVLKNEEVQKYAAEYKNTFDNQPGIKAISDVKETIQDGNSITEEVGEPKSQTDFNDLLEKNNKLNSDLQEKIDELNKKLDENLKETGKKETEVGKWVKKAIGAISIGLLYSMIKDHQAEMNGCWLVNQQTGEKCKVAILTCDESMRNSGSTCPSDKITMVGCGSNRTDPCFAKDSCVESGQITKGNATPSCKTKLEQCNDSSACSMYCNCATIDCPDGYSLQCVNADFWGSAGDFFKEAIKTGDDTVSKIFDSILNILKYILFIGLAILGLYVLYQLIMFAINKIKKKNANLSITP